MQALDDAAAAAVGFVVAEGDAVQEVVAVLLQIEAGVVPAPVGVLDAVYAVDVAAVLLRHVDNKRHFAYPAGSTVRLTE